MKAGFKPRSVWYKSQAVLYDTCKETSDFFGWKEWGRQIEQGQAKNVSFWRAGFDLRPQFLAQVCLNNDVSKYVKNKMFSPHVFGWPFSSVSQVRRPLKCWFNSILSWHVTCVKNVAQTFKTLTFFWNNIFWQIFIHSPPAPPSQS